MSMSVLLHRASPGRRRARASWPVLLPALAWLGVIAMLPAEPVETVGPLTQAQLESDAQQRERWRMVSEVLLWPFGLSPAEAGNASTSTRRNLLDCVSRDAQLPGRNAT